MLFFLWLEYLVQRYIIGKKNLHIEFRTISFSAVLLTELLVEFAFPIVTAKLQSVLHNHVARLRIGTELKHKICQVSFLPPAEGNSLFNFRLPIVKMFAPSFMKVRKSLLLFFLCCFDFVC